MSNLAVSESTSGKADRNRAAILAAAEDVFAKLGYSGTRIDHIADAVKLTRAGLFYYYKDKQALYNAMLEEAFRPLIERLFGVLATPGRSIPERMEMAVEEWIDTLVARPTLARLVLRFVVDGSDQPFTAIISENSKNALMFLALFQEGRANGQIKPMHSNPFHAASALVGTTVLYVSALSNLMPQGEFRALDPKEVAAHKEQALFMLRSLLGIE